MIRHLRLLLSDERGAVLSEYALALVLIAVGALVTLGGVAIAASASFNNSSTAMQAYANASPVP